MAHSAVMRLNGIDDTGRVRTDSCFSVVATVGQREVIPEVATDDRS